MKGVINSVVHTRAGRQCGGATARLIGPYVLVFVLCAALPSAFGLTVAVNYNPILSTGPGNDLAGTSLMAIVQAAADQWENLILDPWAVTIDIRWRNPAGMFDGNALAEGISTSSAGGKPLTGYINFNNTKSFFFDPTPFVDEEFNMQQTLYRDLDGILQSAWYGGSVPSVLETGYGGTVKAGAPAAASNSDLFSVAMHEIGHVLGMNAQLNTVQVADGDYDINPAFVGGVTMDIDDSNEHLPVTMAAMFPSIPSGTRKRMSATDVFAIASAVNWVDIDLRRKDYLGGTIFSDPANWMGNNTPGAFDDAYVRKNNTLPSFAVAQMGMAFNDLHVLEGSWVTTDHVLNVFGQADINGDGATGGDSRVRIQSNGTLFADQLLIDSNGTLELLDGFADIDTDVFIAIGGLLKGSGALFVDDRLVNNGLIAANGVQTLILSTLSPNSVEVWDLGGSGGGVVEAINGDIFIHGSHVGEFNGTMTIGPGHNIDMDQAWTLSSLGFLNLNGTPGNPATFSGNIATIKGPVDVDKDGAMDGDTTFLASAVVRVSNADDRLLLQGLTTLAGGTYIGNGALVQENDFTIAADTTIDTATYDWGNSVPGTSQDTTIEPGVTFTINSPTTGTPDNEYRGVILVDNAVMEVNTSSGWRLPPEEEVAGASRVPKGTLILQDRGGGTAPTVRGQSITVAGLLLTLGGPGVIESELFTQTTGEIDVRIGAELLLKGATTYDSGNIHGGGTLRQIGNANIVGKTTITTAQTDWDGNEGSPSNTFIQPGVAFQILSSQIDDTPATDGYDGIVTVSAGAALRVTTSGQWRMDGTMVLLGQPVTVPQVLVNGSTMVNYGTIQGNGWFQMPVISEGTVSPGMSAGAIRFEQDFTQGNDSILDIEIGGLAAITQFDQITIGGSALIGGVLELSLLNGFMPLQDHEFDIIRSTNPVLGTFSSIVFPTLTGVGLGIRYDPNAVFVTAGLIGDLDGDGFVGINDLNIVLAAWNGNVDAGVWMTGDPTGDGFVGVDDLNIVLANWNNGTPPLTEALANIPEPGTLMLLGASCAALLRRSV